MSEESVCIGDIFRIGEVDVRVSQRAQPCWKLARRWRMHELTGPGCPQRAQRLVSAGPGRRMDRGGDAGDADRAPEPDWTIARANEIVLLPHGLAAYA